MAADPVITEASLADVLPWRDLYRQEMNCQIIHDSIHFREGWTREYILRLGDVPVGYGSVAVGGPWKNNPSIYEFHVAPPSRGRLFELFEAFVAECGAASIETQSNDPTLGVLVHAAARDLRSEKILFEDQITTHHLPPGSATLRSVTAADAAQIAERNLDEIAQWALELKGRIVATGGILTHYNRPYSDLFMSVAESHRRQGLGSYLVQELKRICYERGQVPAARCSPDNHPSRQTLQKAGLVPCGHILIGHIDRSAT